MSSSHLNFGICMQMWSLCCFESERKYLTCIVILQMLPLYHFFFQNCMLKFFWEFYPQSFTLYIPVGWHTPTKFWVNLAVPFQMKSISQKAESHQSHHNCFLYLHLAKHYTLKHLLTSEMGVSSYIIGSELEK